MPLALLAVLGCVSVVDCEPIETPDASASGLEHCWYRKGDEDRGQVNRTELVACPPGEPLQTCASSGGSCASDAACDLGETCADGPEGCACTRSCGTDEHCGSGRVCACPTKPSAPVQVASAVCLEAACRDENDCAGELCGVDIGPDGAWLGSWCRSEAGDRCALDEDCEDGERCGWSGDKWKCL